MRNTFDEEETNNEAELRPFQLRRTWESRYKKNYSVWGHIRHDAAYDMYSDFMQILYNSLLYYGMQFKKYAMRF